MIEDFLPSPPTLVFSNWPPYQSQTTGRHLKDRMCSTAGVGFEMGGRWKERVGCGRWTAESIGGIFLLFFFIAAIYFLSPPMPPYDPFFLLLWGETRVLTRVAGGLQNNIKSQYKIGESAQGAGVSTFSILYCFLWYSCAPCS